MHSQHPVPSLSLVRSLGSLVLVLGLLARPAAAGLNQWTPIHPGSNKLVAVEADAHMPGVLYGAASIRDGYELYRSTDAGESWLAARGLPHQVSSLEADPNRPGTAYAFVSQQGVYRSTDEGATWSFLSSHADFPYQGVINAFPGEDSTLYVLGDRRVFRSDDAGRSWRRLSALEGNLRVLAVDPHDSRILYAGTEDFGSGLLKSSDGGATWVPIPAFLPATYGLVSWLTVLATQPSTVLAATVAGIYKSRDGGISWQPSLGEAPLNDMAVDPGSPATVYISSDRGVFATTDAGDTWAPLSTSGLPRVPSSLEVSPVDHKLYGVAYGQGVYRLADAAWVPLGGRGQAVGFYTWLEIPRPTPSTIYMQVYPDGLPSQFEASQTWKSTDGGQTWSPFVNELDQLNVKHGGDLHWQVFGLVPDPIRPSVLWINTTSGLYRSANAGESWTRVGEARGTLVALGAGRLVEGGCAVRRSMDNGATWTQTLPCPSPTFDGDRQRVFTELLRDPANLGTIWGETFEFIKGEQGSQWIPSAWVSRNNGRSWQRALPEPPIVRSYEEFHYGVVALAPGTVYVATGADLWKSTDNGRTWRKAGSFGLLDGLLDLVADPFDPKTLYAATKQQGVLRSRDSGATWQLVNAGLAAGGRHEISKLVAHPTERGRFFAMAADGGLFEALFMD